MYLFGFSKENVLQLLTTEKIQMSSSFDKDFSFRLCQCFNQQKVWENSGSNIRVFTGSSKSSVMLFKTMLMPFIISKDLYLDKKGRYFNKENTWGNL